MRSVFPAEHAVDDAHVREEVRDRAHVRVPLDVVEQDRVATVEVLLQAGELEVAGHRGVRLHEQALFAQPLDRRGQRAQRLLRRGRTLGVPKLGLRALGVRGRRCRHVSLPILLVRYLGYLGYLGYLSRPRSTALCTKLVPSILVTS